MEKKILVELPCSASEIECALHAICDEHGLWCERVALSDDGKALVMEGAE